MPRQPKEKNRKVFLIFLSLSYFLTFTGSVFFSFLLFSRDSPNLTSKLSTTFPFRLFFTEHQIKVNSEQDNYSEGSLRSAFIKAATLRHKNPFNLVKITFEKNVKKILLQRGPFPAWDEGGISLDCESRVSLEVANTTENENKPLISLTSNSNQISHCEFIAAAHTTLSIEGNENIIVGNQFKSKNAAGNIQVVKTAALQLSNNASRNLISENEFTDHEVAIHLMDNVGLRNRWSANLFKNIRSKEISSLALGKDSKALQLTKLNIQNFEAEVEALDPALENSSSEVSVEIYYHSEDKWKFLKSAQIKPQKGLLKISFSIINLPSPIQFAVLQSHDDLNTSAFSNALELPSENNESQNIGSATLPSQANELTNNPYTPPTSDDRGNELPPPSPAYPKIDPLLNSQTLSGAENLPPLENPNAEVNIHSDTPSGASDSYKVDIQDAPNAP